MSTLGMSCRREALPEPAESSLGGSAFPQPGQPRALCMLASSSEKPHSWEQGDLMLKKWTPQETNLTAFKSCGAGFSFLPYASSASGPFLLCPCQGLLRSWWKSRASR